MSAATTTRLREATQQLRAAARLEGIEPDGPLGAWTRAQEAILDGLADHAERLERLSTDVLGDFKEAAEAELARQRVVTYRAELALRSAQDARESVDVEKARVAGDMIKDVSPKIVEGIREAVVIRERRYNRGVELRRAALVGFTMIGLVVGGYMWRLAQDWTAIEQLSQTQAGLQHCQDTSLYQDKDGHRLCLMTDFIPR